MSAIKTFGPVDERSLEQLERCMKAGDAEFGVLCADHHPGYSQPIGGGIAYEGYVSPSGVGYDIGCGNKAVQTELTRADLDALGGVAPLMDEITRRISFGMGVPARERVDHPVLDKIRNAEFLPQRQVIQLAETQLGTVGSGNHYVNLMEDEQGRIWVGVHFGSRGFGHKTASGFLALAEGKRFNERAHEGEMDSPPVLFEVGSELGESYIAAMQLAGEYAYAGRDVVVDKVLEILGAEAVHEVHNHHNFAWREEHFGRHLLGDPEGLHAGPPGPGGLRRRLDGRRVGRPRGRRVGREREGALLDRARRGPGDEPLEGRGPRAAAAVYACSDRDCEFTVPAKGYAGETCPDHPTAKMRKVRTSRSSGPAWSTGRPSRRACASRASCWSAAARTRRRRCTSACRTFSPPTARRSA